MMGRTFAPARLAEIEEPMAPFGEIATEPPPAMMLALASGGLFAPSSPQPSASAKPAASASAKRKPKPAPSSSAAAAAKAVLLELRTDKPGPGL
jgi:hypothetical protein